MRKLDIFSLRLRMYPHCDFVTVFLSSHFVITFKVANKSAKYNVCYINNCRHYLKLKRVFL
jgi:hypothetical protein